MSEIDLKERGYKISFDSGISSLIVEVNDDDQYEDNEFCIMLIGDDAQCAMLVEIRDNDGRYEFKASKFYTFLF